MDDIDFQIETLKRRCDRFVTESDLRAKLRRSRESGKPLRIKFGMDPTAPDVTLGHCVPLKVIRQFQEWGHKAVLIIGDYTARVGDPSGRNSTRPVLSGEQIDANARTYIEQVSKVLLTGPEHLETRYNGEWLGAMTMEQVIRLLSRKTLAQVLTREDFSKRFAEKTDIRMHELFYPLLQGWDSVQVRADVEMGGSDQLFNNLVGREFQQEDHPGDPLAGQVVIVTPLLVGTDGSAKMSKSKGNYIAVTDPPGGPGGMFGKVMRLPDSLLESYYRLVTDLPESDWRSAVESNPRDAKVRLARYIIEWFHSPADAERAEQEFARTTHGGLPDDVPELIVAPGPQRLAPLLVSAGFVASNSEAIRKIKEGSVRLNGEKVPSDAFTREFDLATGTILQLGNRRFARVVRNG